MIGNDIVDLDLAQKENNWQRKGFLDKIFSRDEQHFILNDPNPELLVWIFWSRKEAAYKIYNRITGIREFFPLGLQCNYDGYESGTVSINEFVFHTQTQITKDYVYSIAVSEISFWNKIKPLDTFENIKKENGIPYIFNVISNSINSVSITHHGRFRRVITCQ